MEGGSQCSHLQMLRMQKREPKSLGSIKKTDDDAVAMLLRCLNLRPADLHCTFEVVQKIFLELARSKPSNKALVLKNRLFE